MFDLVRLIRKNIIELEPYSSARSEYSSGDAVLLDANENPFNHPYNRYPDPLQSELKEGISRRLGIQTGQLFLGNGSDEAIDLLFRAFCEPGRDNAIGMDPSYGMFRVCAGVNNVAYRPVPLTGEFQPDTGRIVRTIDGNTRLVFFCSPNNPSGNLFDRERIVEVLRVFEGLVVIDEAYIDFAGSDGWIGTMDEFPNLVLLRTFSKAWGLAGVRLGMALAGSGIISVLNKIKYPYNVNTLTQQKVLEALEHSGKSIHWIRTIRGERDKLRAALSGLQSVVRIYPSDANFLLVRFSDPAGVYHYLRDRKIILRDRSNLHLCEGCLRITVGTAGENELLLNNLIEYEKNNT